ncbi:hypothetical protein SNE35_08080 [Paucibacter sp. R3-3]|uniref:Uncharacterized protein n=1 Tax=Roseateles agri TaxID=3098619 RepID=A0ABU5DDV2_9BURK|nr:hypothetical protein [Paucibacter sp. R3-3]MDY0744461.1 hypothetical protein [Paucibacter sp. R3-3]
MMINELKGAGDEALVAEAWRLRLIAALRWTSALLARMAARLHRRRGAGKPELEFYAEAGAPEGALYVDGQRVGSLHGVNRL